MTTSIRFLGVAGYEVTGPTFRFLIDPFLTNNPVAPMSPDELETPDVILVTHAAWDHLGDTAALALRTGAPVVCAPDVAVLLEDQGVSGTQIRRTVWGIVVEAGGVIVRPVESHHLSFGQLASGERVTGIPLGYIVETEPGIRIYHFGDSAIFGDMRLIGELYNPTVGILGCALPRLESAKQGGTTLCGEMGPREAALAASYLDVKWAIASHYVDAANPDVQEFLSLMAEQVANGRIGVALEAGEALVLEDGAHRIEEQK